MEVEEQRHEEDQHEKSPVRGCWGVISGIQLGVKEVCFSRWAHLY